MLLMWWRLPWPVCKPGALQQFLALTSIVAAPQLRQLAYDVPPQHSPQEPLPCQKLPRSSSYSSKLRSFSLGLAVSFRPAATAHQVPREDLQRRK